MDLLKKLAIGATCIAVMSSATSPVQAARTCWNHTDAERAFARKINRARAGHGVDRVAMDRHLSRVSRYHTREMLLAGSLFHTGFTKLRRRVTNEVSLGENIGYAGGVRRLFKLMMGSTAHRANILNPAWNYVGLGTSRKGGRLWVTMTFEARQNPGTRLSMPRC